MKEEIWNELYLYLYLFRIEIGVFKISRNVLARPVMGTIFLVIIISIMIKSQETTVFHGRQKLTSAMKEKW